MQNNEEKGMTLIVKTVTRLTLGFILLYGVYVAMSGHASPGGGFAGGVIIALSFMHIMLAFGKDVALKRFNSYVLRVFLGMGALGFLYIALLRQSSVCVPLNKIFGSVKSCPIFNNDIIIPFCEMLIVGSSLFAIFIALVLLSKTDRNSE